MGFVVGVVAGLVAAIPLAWVLRRARRMAKDNPGEQSIGVGLALIGLILSLLLFHAAAIFAWRAYPNELAPFATGGVLSFLGLTLCVALGR